VKIVNSILDVIGNTPLLRLNKIPGSVVAEILAKLEYLNPSGSIKDRIAKYMIESAERQGALGPGYKIVEASTGNTGTALAFVSAVKGYQMIVFCPSVTSSEERVRIMKSYGAQINVINLEQEKNLPDLSVHGGVIEIIPRQKCRDLEKTSGDVGWTRQFSNPDQVPISGEIHDVNASQVLRHVDRSAQEEIFSNKEVFG
jgi:cysteine synthase